MAHPKLERNKQLVALRNQDPKKYSFYKLASIFNIEPETAHEIYWREMRRSKATV